MDQLIADLQQAKDNSSTLAIIGKIQTLWNETVPSAPIGGLTSFWAWQKNVHGVVPTATGIMLFDQAWMARSSVPAHTESPVRRESGGALSCLRRLALRNPFDQDDCIEICCRSI